MKYIGSYQDRANLYIITEKCTGGEVFDRLLKLKRFSEQEVVSIATQALRAIAYIHSKNIIHRDIKAENFLYSSDPRTILGSSNHLGQVPQIKLIDFGLAVRLRSDNEVLTSVVGSAHYLAPEMIRQQYSKSVDIWSVGVLVYLMLFGRYPFDGNNDDIIISKIRKSKIEWNISDISNQARSFLQALLERDPSIRLTASQALGHPFLTCSIAAPVFEEKAVLSSSSPQILESSSTGQPPSEDQYPTGPRDMEYYYSISKGDLSGFPRPPAIDQGRILRSINT